MDLFEYQGKQYFARYGISVSPGDVADTVEQAVEVAERIGYPVVVKAQVKVGGRGKAGGVKLAHDVDEVRLHAGNILGLDIKGHVVHRLWVEFIKGRPLPWPEYRAATRRVLVRDERRTARVWVGRSHSVPELERHEREDERGHYANGGASEYASNPSPIHHELIFWRTDIRINASKARSVRRRRSKRSCAAPPRVAWRVLGLRACMASLRNVVGMVKL